MAVETRTPFLPILCRVFWLMLGPLLLVVLTFMIATTGNGWLTPADVGFLGILVALMIARWLEFRGGNPQTAEGEPATPAHLRRYLIVVVAFGLGLWIVANIVGNYVLAS